VYIFTLPAYRRKRLWLSTEILL